jgi:hypothetical protein
MDISVEQNKPDVSRPSPLPAVLQAVKDVTRRLIGFFVLSKEEQLQAGIDFRGKERRE